METVDIHHLKAGEVNLGVRIVLYAASKPTWGASVADGTDANRHRSWPYSLKMAW